MWRVDVVSDAAIAEIADLPDDLRKRFARLVITIEEQGVHRLREPDAKHVEGKLWELRLSGRDRIARSLYVTQSGQRVLILRTFIKKAQKLPRKEIELALARLASRR